MFKSRSSFPVLFPALVALTTLVVHLASVRNGFVTWDDYDYVVDNPHIRSLGGAFFRWALSDSSISYWHPLTWLSHALDYAVWGLNPVGHHLTNVLIHAANTFLVVVLVRKLLAAVKARGGSAFLAGWDEQSLLVAACVTGVLFGMHPLRVESVAWVSERKDLLSALFSLLCISAFLRDSGDSARTTAGLVLNKRYLLTLLFFALAVASKPMAVTLTVVLLILDWYPLGRIRSRRELLNAVIEKSLFVISAAVSLITVLAQRATGPLSQWKKFPWGTV